VTTLELHRETIQHLKDDEAEQVGGGMRPRSLADNSCIKMLCRSKACGQTSVRGSYCN